MRRCWTVMVLAAAGLCLGADWPGWRGPNRDAISPDTGINKDWNANAPKELWRVKVGDLGHAGPAVADGKVFILDHKGSEDIVRAIDLSTGKDVWKTRYEDASKQNYGFSRATPLVENGKVCTVSFNGNVHCLDAKDGKILWKKSLVGDFGGRAPQWMFAMSPVIDGEKLILVTGATGGDVIAVNKDTGDVLWKGGGGDLPGYSTPVVATLAGKRQYLVFMANALTGVDAADGKRLWKFQWQTEYDVNAATPIVVGDDSVFITSGYNRGCALVKVTADAATKVWENKNIKSHFNSPVLSGGYLYGTSDPGDLVCLDAKTGNVVWKQDGFEKGGLLAIDGVIIAQDGRRGTLVMCELSPKGYKELGRINAFPKCRQRAWAPPIVADKKLIARDMSELVCYDLK